MSALRTYKAKLHEIDDIRRKQAQTRKKTNSIIISKMGNLATQLDGDARALIEEDIEKIKGMFSQSTNPSGAEIEENELITIAFERMSDQVVALIEASERKILRQPGTRQGRLTLQRVSSLPI